MIKAINRLFKIFGLIIVISLIAIPAFSADSVLCIDKEGFVYPVLDENKGCDEGFYAKITLDEYRHIKTFERSERIKKLEEYKLEAKNQKIKKAKKAKITKEDLEGIKKEIVEKSKFDEKILQLKQAREEKRKQQFAKQKEREKQQAERKRIQDQKRKEMLAEKAERKRIQDQKRKEMLAEKAERKRIQDQKRKEMLAEKAEVKRIQDQKRKEMLAEKAERDRINEGNKNIEESNKEIVVNENLKVVLFNKKIVKSDLFPNLNSVENIDFEIVDQLEEKKVNDLIKTNSNLVLIIPKDFDVFSSSVSENEMVSKVVSGIRQVPNPDFNRLQMEMRRAERELRRAQAEAERAFQMTQCYSCGLVTQWGGVALQSKWQKEAARLQSRLSSLTSSYSSVSQYKDQELYSSYNYQLVNVKSEKKAIYKVVQNIKGTYFGSKVNLAEEKTFQVARGVNPQDKRYEQLMNKYDSPDSVKNWENKRIESMSIDSFLTKLDNVEKEKLRGTRGLYAVLDLKSKRSKFRNIFGKKKNKTKKLSSSNKQYSVRDKRFDSVVVVRAGNSLGSGFYIGSDEIITNYHVIEDARSIYIVDRDRNRSSAIVIKKDMKRDLALLKTNSKGKPVSFFNGQIKQGAMVEALGHPKGRKFSLTKGWVSAIRKESSVYNVGSGENVLYIQTDAAINKGNSGGPLFMENKVVGVNTQGLSKKKTEGMNFAVHFSEVQDFLNN